MTLKAKKSLERFTKKNCNKQIKINFDLKNEQRGNEINYILNGKATVVLLVAGLINLKICYFPHYSYSKN